MRMVQKTLARRQTLIKWALGLLIVSMSVCPAFASTLTYTFTGNGSGSVIGLFGSDFTNSNFTLTFWENPSDVVSGGPGYYRLNDVTGLFQEGWYLLPISDVTIVVNANSSGGEWGSVNFFNGAFNNGLGFSNSSELVGYSLASNIGPVWGSAGNLTPTLGGGTFSAGWFDDIEFTSENSLSFDVSGSAVPEPATLMLLFTGFALGALFLRRKGMTSSDRVR
jgi:hypothetical protein